MAHDPLALALAGFTLVSLAIAVLAAGSVFRVLRARRWTTTAPRPPISVLKPVKGVDPGLYENLCALAEQDYPDFEIHLGAADPHDPALAVARAVQLRYPQVAIHVGACAVRSATLNPKVALLEVLSERATHDWQLISDSNVRPPRDYLAGLADELRDPKVGMVTSVLVGQGDGTLGGLLENLHLNSFVVAATSFVRVFGHRACVIGKSILLSRRALLATGGFRPLRDLLAEDYALGRRAELSGRAVAVAAQVLPVIHDGWTVERHTSRHLRWGQMRRCVSPSAFFAEPLLNPVALAFVASWVALWRGERPGQVTAAFAAVALVKGAADTALWHRLRERWPSPKAVLLLPVKDLLLAGIWALSAVRRTVEWRGTKLLVGPGSRLSVPPPRRSLRPAVLARAAQVVRAARSVRVARRVLRPAQAQRAAPLAAWDPGYDAELPATLAAMR